MRDTSLVYPICDDGRIWLGRKKRGMGAGKWNGFGGKQEDGETMRQCAVRELREECGLVANGADLELAADLYFEQLFDETWSHGGKIYFLRNWTGTICESDEMKPRLFASADFPYDHMWRADRIWVPVILSGKQIKGRIIFGEDGESIVSYAFRETLLYE